MFKPIVHVTYVENNLERKKGIFKKLYKEDRDHIQDNLCKPKGILKRNAHRSYWCPCSKCKGDNISDDFWYPNWKEDVRKSKENTNIWFWYRVARRHKSLEYLKFGLDI